ncbi:MAG TPA: DUF481 domain-containing protein, partial [Steroidobacter sp.]
MPRRLLGAVGASMVLATVLTVLPEAAWAQWSMKAEAGLVANRGNTDADSSNLKLDVTRAYVKWRHNFGLAAVYASDSTGTTAQRWEARGQTDYDFSQKGFAFASGRYEDDRFSGFEYQTTYGLGLGYRFFDDPITKLTSQLGFGYKISQTREALDVDGITIIPRRRERDLVGQGRLDFEHKLTETTSALAKFLVEWTEPNTFSQSDLSLQVKIIDALALAVGYSVRYNTDPPPGFRHTDTL